MSRQQDRRHASIRRPFLHRFRRRVRRDGSLRQARLRGGGDSGHAPCHRFVFAAGLFWLLVTAWAARKVARAVPPRCGRGPRARCRRLRRPGGRLLRGARAPRRLPALVARVHVPGHGRRGRRGTRSRGGEPPYRRGPGAGLGRPRSRPRRGLRGSVGCARDRSGAGSGGRLQRVHPDLGRRRRARRAARTGRAGVHRRRRNPHGRRPGRR